MTTTMAQGPTMAENMRDAAARLRALTDLDTTLLVEAGAGTGKTSLLAARVTMLLMRGRLPFEIAAITFTEAAASELAERIHGYVSALLRGVTPEPMRDALPGGAAASELSLLRAAADALDGLTTTTIHGFCQTLLADFAVEADVDPGAQILDEDMARAMFERVFDNWLTRRLSVPHAHDDPVLLLTREDPRNVVQLLREIAAKRRRHRNSTAPAHDPEGRPDIELREAVDDLQRWCREVPRTDVVARIVDELDGIASQYDDRFATRPDFARLWRLAHPERSPRMVRGGYALHRPRTESAWRKAAGADRAPALETEFQARFDRVDAAYRRLLSEIAAAITGRLSQELDEVLADYATTKRSAAVLDFDDLLELTVAMLRGHPEIRAATAERFRHLLIDEFQDTDPVQCDIVFRIGGRAHADHWTEVPQRPGALFLVGDPKQSLFLFRGADVNSYEAAKAVVTGQFPGALVQITSNFRTIEDILTHVNRCFAEPLSASGQPGYVALDATRRRRIHALPCAARLAVALPDAARVGEVRDAEAAEVAEACARLVGGLDLEEPDGTMRKARPGDVALLAPAGTELWRYERALQERGLPYASKAGRGFFRRQEVQDLVALTRSLADRDDTLALGALLRGPLVGMTDESLLDATAALPHPTDGRPPQLTLRTPPCEIGDPHLRQVMEVLQDLRRRARATTPSQLLIEAVERLAVRVALSRREPRRASAANANVDLFLQRAAAYPIRGLRRFAQDVTAAWAAADPATEGRVDAEGEAIDIVSIHSAKGLEWPIVVLINMASSPPPRDRIVHRAGDGTLHWTVGGVAAPQLEEALDAEARDLGRERARLIYVGCTRARDLLILPAVTGSNATSYARAVDLRFDGLPPLDLSGLTGARHRPDRGPDNPQSEELFIEETERIAASSRPTRWLRPSAEDADRIDRDDRTGEEELQFVDGPEIAGAGRLRGLLLHKLLEEMVTGELEERPAAVAARSRLLLAELASGAPAGTDPPDPDEVASSALATLAIPEVAALRHNLRAEVPVYATVEDVVGTAALAGRADALVVEDGAVTAVLDWKSDVAPGERQLREHAEQLRLYLAATGVRRGAVVYARLGRVRWVELPPG